METAIAIGIVVLAAALVAWQLYRDARGKGGCGGGCGGCTPGQDPCPRDDSEQSEQK